MKPWLWITAYLSILYGSLGLARDVVDSLRSHDLLALTIGGSAIAFAATILGWGSVTYAKSLQRRESQQKGSMFSSSYWKGLTPIVLSFVVVGCLVLQIEAWEERAHFIQYGVLALLVGWALREHTAGWRRFVGITTFCAIAGSIDEAIQYFLPSRYFDLRDIAFNCLAGIWGATLHMLIDRGAKVPSPVEDR